MTECQVPLQLFLYLTIFTLFFFLLWSFLSIVMISVTAQTAKISQPHPPSSSNPPFRSSKQRCLGKHSDTTFLNVWPLTYLFLHYQTSPSYSSCSQLRSTDTLVLCVHKYSAGMQYYLDTCHLNETWSEKWAEKYNRRHSRLILMYIYPDRPEVRIFLLQMYPEVSSTW